MATMHAKNKQKIRHRMQRISRMTPTATPLAVLLSILLLELTILTSALKVSVSIPELVKLNDAFWLNCSHSKQAADLQQSLGSPSRDVGSGSARVEYTATQTEAQSSEEDIYAIKWYKDDEEFYRFLPNAQPKVSIYETNGIQLDQAKSHEGNVFISKADVNSEGNYRCEILSEAPLFETVRKTKHLKVYALPVRGPRIEILDASGRPKSPKAQEISYSVGDKIELRCNSVPSKPPARLRWYLNEHELLIPSPSNSTGERQRRLASTVGTGSGPSTGQQLGYDVRVTPIEYRQHYKGIYSSHSTLTLVLQQDDLINNKISFKCLASMRQEVAVRSKQLIVLTPGTTVPPNGPANFRARRSSSAELLGASDSEAHVYHRQRPQQHRHGISRLLPAPSLRAQTGQQSPRAQTAAVAVASPASELISNLQEDSRNVLMYIYEQADSTLGSSIIDGPENLESYLRRLSGVPAPNKSVSDNNNYQPTGDSQFLEFNRADNLEYIQLIRERLARQRSLPNGQQMSANSAGGGSVGISTGVGGSHKRPGHGSSSLVKSPLYLDENDPLRPIISWPPLESGKLALLPPGNTIVAIPTPSISTSSSSRRSSFSLDGSEQRLILPISNSLDSLEAHSNNNNNDLPGTRSRLVPGGDSYETHSAKQQIILERLAHNLNCTCTDGSIDTKLAWLINDVPLDTRDTRYYPTRISPDHRQTWITIGLQVAPFGGGHPSHPSSSSLLAIPNPLSSILARYFREHQAATNAAVSGSTGFRSDQRQTLMSINNSQQSSSPANSHIKFICQAIHSMLLYSSSEMITFDFNPPPNQVEGNSIDRFASSPSNVIQATSASQSSSAQGRNSIIISIRSQTSLLLSLLISSFISLYIILLPKHPSPPNIIKNSRRPHC